MIVGVVTEDGIVIFSFFNQLREREPHRPLIELNASQADCRNRVLDNVASVKVLKCFSRSSQTLRVQFECHRT
jgi:hypothetical protein